MRLLTITDVCDVLKISRSKLYSLWERGEGPDYLQIGAQRRIRSDVLDEWIEAQVSVN